LELERAISAEKQGIARAHRLGLRHPLSVIRFYTRHTLEEEVVKDRKIALPDAAEIMVAEVRNQNRLVEVDDDDASDVYQESLNLDEMTGDEVEEDEADELEDF
jgi:SNF2 family DNA or RNA helicase